MYRKTATPDPFARQRRFPRHALDVRVSIQVFRNGKNISFWGRTSELGMDGIGATLTGALDTGEVVSMELCLPLTPIPIKMRAIVRYRQGLRHGFEFLTLTRDQRSTMERVCEMLTVGT
jgi:PilZ domain